MRSSTVGPHLEPGLKESIDPLIETKLAAEMTATIAAPIATIAAMETAATGV